MKLERLEKKSKKIFKLDGNEPSYIDMIPWYTHNIRNIGSAPLITLFWINEFLKTVNLTHTMKSLIL